MAESIIYSQLIEQIHLKISIYGDSQVVYTW